MLATFITAVTAFSFKAFSVASLALNPFVAPTGECVFRSPVANIDSLVVVDNFRAPKCDRCAGNRGVEFSLQSDSPIFSVSDGVVTFSGIVAGTKYLVVQTPNLRRITYGRIKSSAVRAGDVVKAGQQIGTSTDKLYFGVREYLQSGAMMTVRYVDPMQFLKIDTENAPKAVLVFAGDSNLRARSLLPNSRC